MDVQGCAAQRAPQQLERDADVAARRRVAVARDVHRRGQPGLAGAHHVQRHLRRAPQRALDCRFSRGLLLLGRLGQPIRRHHRVVGLRVVGDELRGVFAQRQQGRLGLIQRARSSSDPARVRPICATIATSDRPSAAASARPIRRPASEPDRRRPRAIPPAGDRARSWRTVCLNRLALRRRRNL